jgi:replication factor A1
VEVLNDVRAEIMLGQPKSFDQKVTVGQNNASIGGTGFYGAQSKPAQETMPQMPRQQLPTPGPSEGGQGSRISPIESLTPYKTKWTIKARVTSKSDIRTWHKATGEGKLFSVSLLDETGEIKATGFNDQCDQFYPQLSVGSVYYISTPARVSIAKKQFNNLAHDYEFTFDHNTQVEKCEDQSDVPQVSFNFCSIQDLSNVEKDATVDVIGVLKEVQEVSQIQAKSTGKDYEKRELVLVDDTGYSVRVTIWGKTAVSFDAQPESIVAFKGMRVGDYGGRSLSLLSSGTMTVDPDISEAHRLKGWFDAAGRGDNFASHSGMASLGAASGRTNPTKCISQIKEENLGTDGDEYFNLQATVMYIMSSPTPFAYPACRTDKCNKKVVDLGDGSGWRCEKCEVTHERPQYRYIMTVNAYDHTGQLWLTCFDDQGRQVMGKSADELMELVETGNEAALAAELQAATGKRYNFRCRAKMDTYGENSRFVLPAPPLLDWREPG